MEEEVNKKNNKQHTVYQRLQHFSSLKSLQAENILCDINIEVHYYKRFNYVKEK